MDEKILKFKRNERMIKKSDIAAELDAARGGEPLGMEGFVILFYGWLCSKGYYYYTRAYHQLVSRDWLWYNEYRNFMQYAGVACSL